MRLCFVAALVVLGLVASSSAEAEPVRCMIAGEKVDLTDIKVSYDGGALSVSTQKVAARVFPGSKASAYSVDVEAPLYFHGTVAAAPIQVARDTLAWRGGLRMEPATPLTEVAFDREKQLRGRADLGMQVSLQNVPLDCDDLTLDAVKQPAARRPAPIDPDYEEMVAPTGRLLTFSLTPGGAEHVRLDQGSFRVVYLDQLRDEGRWLTPWTRAHVEFGGVSLTGWVARSAVARVTMMHGYGQTGGGSSNHGCLSGSSRSRSVRLGPARLEKGAIIYAEPGKGAWASVVSPTGYVARLVRGAAFASLERIDGLRSSGCRVPAFVAASAVDFL